MSESKSAANSLEGTIVDVIRKLSDSATVALAAKLDQIEPLSWNRRRSALRSAMIHPAAQDQADRLMDAWQAMDEAPAASAVALAVRSAAAMEQRLRDWLRVDLAWTGPSTTAVPLRHTDQVLLTLIAEATTRLDLMSFAVHKVPQVSEALVAAAERGVELRIYLETSDSSQGKMAANTIRNLGTSVAERSRIYVWPPHQRKTAPSGYQGVLHAKLAVADGHLLFVTSANLTQAALHLNMEMGLLVRGGDEPARVVQHLDQLVEKKVFMPAPAGGGEAALSPTQQQAWDEAFVYADARCHRRMETLRERGVEAPQVGYALLPPGARSVVAEAELAWPSSQVALLIEPGDGDATRFEEAGWQVFEPGFDDAILHALGAT